MGDKASSRLRLEALEQYMQFNESWKRRMLQTKNQYKVSWSPESATTGNGDTTTMHALATC